MADPSNPSAPHPFSVAVRGARLDFGGRALFDRLDFDLVGGAWTCLLGASGVGKTSLLRLIAGLAEPAPGTTITCGDGLPVAGRAAYMAQQDLLMPWLTAIGNVTIGSRLRGARQGRRETEECARELLDLVGLGGRADDLPAALSGGERQRVAIARTLMEDRPVVLMDEPFSALDAITRHRLQAQAAELLAGRTVLLVTHDPLEALRLGHRVQIMHGQPAELGPALTPAGAPPRDVRDKAILEQQAELLDQLARADAAPEAAA